MIHGSIGRRYAKAFLDIARKEGKIEERLSELESFGEALRSSKEMNFLMTDPAFEPEQRKKILVSLSERLRLSPMTLNFLKILIDRDRLGFYEDILRSYREQADEALGRVRVKVSVPDSLGEASLQKLQRILEKMTRRKVLLETESNPDILGGMVIKIKDMVFDGSIRSALRRMKEKMMDAGISFSSIDMRSH
jgi:F-type H+-transporting ATPase subunit delta